jgi:hypothetical protein
MERLSKSSPKDHEKLTGEPVSPADRNSVAFTREKRGIVQEPWTFYLLTFREIFGRTQLRQVCINNDC